MNTELGKIESAEFGVGGYQDICIGINFTLSGKSWRVQDFKGDWATKWDDNCEWTEDERLKRLGETCMFIADLLKKAKVSSVSRLRGTPVEVTFENRTLKSWRVLEEVL